MKLHIFSLQTKSHIMGNFKIHLFSEIIYTLVYLSELKSIFEAKRPQTLLVWHHFMSMVAAVETG